MGRFSGLPAIHFATCLPVCLLCLSICMQVLVGPCNKACMPNYCIPYACTHPPHTPYDGRPPTPPSTQYERHPHGGHIGSSGGSPKRSVFASLHANDLSLVSPPPESPRSSSPGGTLQQQNQQRPPSQRPPWYKQTAGAAPGGKGPGSEAGEGTGPDTSAPLFARTVAAPDAASVL